ncbi:flagellar basal body P-ring protein FlgI [Vibrio marisflavi]|uniref:Flagellar P-ring protein n=1 Tax=Vibrio marisflavi CECT 7928 TaxID=634439 RepID=A0ABM9A523_9VIBR|nr:flagellar basal body P-ring protein FlgI [Vibrio marisflavi]CAH0540053.1 Flagellar P-ring protein [Vibrio marisflavi CECT 7928]
MKLRSFLILFCLLLGQTAHAERLLNLVNIQGIRSNKLVGYGLVVGLDGSGDRTSQTPFTSQSIKNMLDQFGVQSDGRVDLRNVAAVSVTASLPANMQPGQTIDVTVSSIGDASSLKGGTLLMTPMKGMDGNIYAVAQGNLIVGGVKAQGRTGTGITINLPTVGRIPGGATVERTVPSGLSKSRTLLLSLRDPSFVTARNIERAINGVFGSSEAEALNERSVKVKVPLNSDQRVTFMAMLEQLNVQAGDPPAIVVIDARTGTVVMGGDVKLRQAAVAHGNLVVQISEKYNVSQPPPFNKGGRTVVTPESKVKIKGNNPTHVFLLPAGATLAKVVAALNSVGASTTDLMAILEALKKAGALEAQLKVI